MEMNSSGFATSTINGNAAPGADQPFSSCPGSQVPRQNARVLVLLMGQVTGDAAVTSLKSSVQNGFVVPGVVLAAGAVENNTLFQSKTRNYAFMAAFDVLNSDTLTPTILFRGAGGTHTILQNGLLVFVMQ